MCSDDSRLPRNCQFKNAECFPSLINYNYVWLERGDYDLRWNSTTTLCLVTIYINIAGVLATVQTLLNVRQDIIMAVCLPSLVETDHTTVENMIQCLPLTAKTLLVGDLPPQLEIDFSR